MFAALNQTVKAKPSFADIQADVLAGLTVGIVALPLSMAFAIASGVAPQHGLYTAIVAGIVSSLAGGSTINISGPTAAFVVVLLPIVHQFGLGGLLLSGLMAGIMLIGMGMARLGSLIEVVPYPVTLGFTSGIAVIIATFQIKDFFGLTVAPVDGHYLEQLGAIVQAAPTFRLIDFLIGLLTLATLLLWRRFRSRVPSHLAAVILGSIAAWACSRVSPELTVATIGSRFHFELQGVVGNGIPPFAPSFDWPWNLPGADGLPVGLSWKMIHTLFPSAIAIAVLGAITSLLCSVIADGMSAGHKHDSNDELIGQGIGNIIAPFFGGIPATAAIARTATNIKAGGRTPLAATVHSIFVLLSILLIAPLLSRIPMASMAALLFMVAWNMSETKHFIRTVKVAPRSDVAVLLICFSLTVLFDMAIAVGVGMSLAAILFIQRSISLTTATKVQGRAELGELPASVAVYDINGPLFFGSAQKAMKNITSVTPDVRAVVLDMSKVNMIDMSAIVAMESISRNLQKNGVGLIVSGLQPQMILKLRRAGLRKKSGKVEFSRTLAEGIAKARKML
uniref:C4-dicarboxylic acid transporter DauA n=1 Tax=Candidatus Electronema sp. TaxID=2698783 RepID=UPI0040565DFD